ncbi:ribose-5-phosphate isomerase A [Pedobacter quisquiliarum]|uniref:Ribose-5-phosphate isomerase A n=1 Tax=Pedobacter quisquiliarum TaxID=1834438 RepID=A0A916XAY3_9SPHI|nr:ribose-5-phosphate isomerase RpiA [Pedobacter quisquiliarum]GGC60595.1 ribose-5-phosphate isomerase A [Pedobacter quisquiliarum]
MEKTSTQKDNEKKLAAAAAVKFVQEGSIVGLGTGSSAFYAIQEIAALVKQGMQIQGVATSEQTAYLAESLGIPVLGFDEVHAIDITIDGADEFTTDRKLIKGGGGALFREKIVASMSKQEIIIADASKLVKQLGAFTIPIEVIPLATNYVLQELKLIGGSALLRKKSGHLFVTDNGNHIIDADFGLIDHPEALAKALNNIDGLLAHGIFIDLATKVIMADGDDVVYF